MIQITIDISQTTLNELERDIAHYERGARVGSASSKRRLRTLRVLREFVATAATEAEIVAGILENNPVPDHINILRRDQRAVTREAHPFRYLPEDG